jgi:tetratricopeptide (TPR) repeat protein
MAAEAVTKLPQSGSTPQTAEDYFQRAWSYYVKGDQNNAEQDFQQALLADSQSVEAYYGLGLTLKMQGNLEPALQAFEKAIDLVKAGEMQEDRVRATMLRNLAEWHINSLKTRKNMGEKP